MREGKPAFACPTNLRVTQFSVTSTLSTCRFFKPLLFEAKRISHLHASHFTIKANTDGHSFDEDPDKEPVLEGDVVVYRERTSEAWSIGAIVEVPQMERYSVRPLCSHSPEEEGSLECFVNWDADSGELSIRSETYEIALVDADYEERVVQDRLANPHGEVSEDCWRISTQVLNSFNVCIPRI